MQNYLAHTASLVSPLIVLNCHLSADRVRLGMESLLDSSGRLYHKLDGEAYASAATAHVSVSCTCGMSDVPQCFE